MIAKQDLDREGAVKPRRRAPRPMHKRHLVASVARRTSLTQAQVREALHGILTAIAEEIATGGSVTLVGFGRFEARAHQARDVHGLDGETYRVGGRLVPSFHAYPALRRQMRAGLKEDMEEQDDATD